MINHGEVGCHEGHHTNDALARTEEALFRLDPDHLTPIQNATHQSLSPGTVKTLDPTKRRQKTPQNKTESVIAALFAHLSQTPFVENFL